jgi:hypothetical protein
VLGRLGGQDAAQRLFRAVIRLKGVGGRSEHPGLRLADSLEGNGRNDAALAAPGRQKDF